MFTKLENYLDKWVSVERKSAIIDALKVLTDYGSMSAWAEISAYLESATDESLSMIIDTIEGIITVGIDSVLSAHTIIMDGSYVLKTAALRGLQVMPVWSDTQTIQSLTMECRDPVASFCDLLELTTEYRSGDYIDFIVDVSPKLLEKIYNLSVGIEENEDIDMMDDLDPRRKKLLISYLSLFKNSIAQTEIIDNLLPPGLMDIEFIVENHKRYLLSLEPEGPDVAAMQLLGIALTSRTEVDKLLKACKEQLDVIFTDINFIGKVDIALTNVYNKVFSHGQA